MAAYQLGQTIYWSLRITSDGSTPADLGGGNPTATVTLPDGTTAAALVTKISTGNYLAALLSTQLGRHVVTWAGTGANSGGLPYADASALVGSLAIFELSQLAANLRVDALDDPRAELARARAENYLRTQLRIELAPTSLVLQKRVPVGLTSLQLIGPLVSVESVTVDGAALTTVTDFEVTERGVSCPLGFGQYVTSGAEWCSLVIAYTAGFTQIPGELIDWGLYLAGLAYERGAQPGVRSVSVDGVSESYQDGAAAVELPESVLRDLRRRYAGRAGIGSVLIR